MLSLVDCRAVGMERISMSVSFRSYGYSVIVYVRMQQEERRGERGQTGGQARR